MTWRALTLKQPLGGSPMKCTIDGCQSGAKARGWCMKHYKRWSKHGDPLHEYQRNNPKEHRGPFSGCWE